jgi:anti-anti-sigma regulatory factor
MQARIRKSKEITNVELLGKVNYESLEGFIDLCRKELRGKNVVFNLEGLNFVGSCGVTNFLQVLASLQRMPATRIKYVGIAKEFVKLFQTMEETKIVTLDIHTSEFEAAKSFDTPVVVAPAVVVVVEASEAVVTAPHDLQQKNLES